MARTDELRIRISAQDQASSVIRRVTGGVMALAGAYLSIQGVRQVIGLVQSFTREAAQQEKQVAKLVQQLRNWDDYTKENINSLTGLADSLAKVTQFSDDQIVAGQAMLGSFALTSDQIKEATTRMVDIAVMTESATGQISDLTAVAKMMGMALNRNAGMLSRAGIVMSDYQRETLNASKGSERFALLMEILDQNAQGLATAVGKTWAGGMAIAKNQVDELRETMGEAIIKNAVWTEALGFVNEKIVELNVWLKDNQATVREWATQIAFSAVNMAQFISDVFFDLQTAIAATSKAFIQLGIVMSYTRVGGKEDRIMMQGMAEDMDKWGEGAQTVKNKIADLAAELDTRMRNAIGGTTEVLQNLGKVTDDTVSGIGKTLNTTMTATMSIGVGTNKVIKDLGLQMGQTGVATGETTRKISEMTTMAVQFTNQWASGVIDSIFEANFAFGKFVKDFIIGMTKMIVKMLAFKAIKSIFGVGFFGKGGLVPAFQAGGYVMGPGGYDKVMARLTAGEFVMNKSATQRIGADNLARMNSGNTFNTPVTVNVNVSGSGSGQRDAYAISNELKRVLPAVLKDLERRRKT